MGDVVVFVDDLKSNYAFSYCRICHEEELQSCKSLEAPCACSGTIKVKKKLVFSTKKKKKKGEKELVLFLCSCGCVLILVILNKVVTFFYLFIFYVGVF